MKVSVATGCIMIMTLVYSGSWCDIFGTMDSIHGLQGKVAQFVDSVTSAKLVYLE